VSDKLSRTAFLRAHASGDLVSVPREPTEAMINAMDAAYFADGGNLNKDGIAYAAWVEAYRAMLDAAIKGERG